MSALTVAKKDFRDGARAKSLWALTVIFVLFAGGIAYLYAGTDLITGAGDPELTAIGLIGFIQSAGALLVPIIGLLIGYKAVVGERASGSLKILLGLPHTRADVVFGKLVGRTLVVALPILVGYLVAAGIGLAMFDSFSMVDYVLFVGLTVLFALAYVSIAVGFSSAMASESRAAALAIGLWVLFQLGWQALGFLVLWAYNGFTLAGLDTVPEWYQLLLQATPNGGYGMATLMFLPDQFAPDTNTFFLQDWFGLVILAFWIVVPVALGYWRFERADL